MDTPKITHPDSKILIIDDDVDVLETISSTLEMAGWSNVVTLADGCMALDTLKKDHYSCVLLDLNMPNISGQELLGSIGATFPGIPIIVITAIEDLETVVSCMRAGAHDYLVKPIRESRLFTAVENAIRLKSIKDEQMALKKSLLERETRTHKAFEEFITAHPRIISIFSYLEAILKTPFPILITGESGTGKGIMARGFYKLCGCAGEFIAVNVAGLDDTLFSDTLFGHKKGAFTGADSGRNGLLQKAENGIILLDEIGDLEISSQVKLLHLLQDREYHPVGSDEIRKTSAKFVVASNRNLEKLVEEGKFRSDLYYRLTTHSVHIPSLRERLEDLPLLIRHFIKKHAGIFGKEPPDYSPELLEVLSCHPFSGNVRELENMLANAVATSQGNILNLDGLKKIVKWDAPKKLKKPEMQSFLKDGTNAPSLKEFENEYIAWVLKQSSNDITKAAKILGMNYSSLYRRLQKANQAEKVNSIELPVGKKRK